MWRITRPEDEIIALGEGRGNWVGLCGNGELPYDILTHVCYQHMLYTRA
jgi:hypothetical protein